MLMNGMVRPPGQRFIRFQEGRDWACAHGPKPQRDEGMTQTSPLKVEYVEYHLVSMAGAPVAPPPPPPGAPEASKGSGAPSSRVSGDN